MKIKSSITFLLIISSLLFGCGKKDSSTTTSTIPFKKIQTITYNYGATDTFTYNSDGKLSMHTENDGPNDGFTTNYSYSGNNVFKTTVNQPSGFTDSYTFTLNSSGYATGSVGNSGGRSYLRTFEYDSVGHVTKEVCTSGSAGFTISYTYSNGNMVNRVMTSGTYIETSSYEYYLNYENTIGFEHYGSDFMGRSSKNLVKKETWMSGTSSNIRNYTYEFDKNNYATKQIETGVNKWIAYTYK